MQVHDLVQGSEEWLAHRKNYLNASDAPAMLGESKYKTRDDLLHEKATGMVPEVNQAIQKIFDDGHMFEALARPYAEEITGEPLYPVTGTDEEYSASFDGLTIAEDIAFEHKTLNKELVSFFDNGGNGEDLPLMYRIQMEQQLMVSDADKCLFMASKWQGEELIEERHCWYFPDILLRQRIIDGWDQFKKDLEAYVPAVVIEKVEAEQVQSLPVPSVQVKGELVACNLNALIPMFDKFLSETKTKLESDQDFVNADVNAKKSREAATNLKLTAKAVVNQMASVSEVVGTLENYAKAFDTLGLTLEKAVKEQKETIKTNAILTAKQAFNEHIKSLEEETKPIRLNIAIPDFAIAIKGIKTISSMQSRINDALANGKIEADATALDIRKKKAWLKEHADGYQFLFNDIQTIINKEFDDLKMLANSRIVEHKKAEAELKAKAELDARLKVEAEQREKEAEQKKIIEVESAVKAEIVIQDPIGTIGNVSTIIYAPEVTAIPSAQEIVKAVANCYMVDDAIAHKWLCDIDFAGMLKAA
jgi:putative phage-type endonuclease